MSCGNGPGKKRKNNPKVKAGERYDVASYRRAIYRACDKAFPPEPPLAKRKDETIAQWKNRLKSSNQLEKLKRWQKKHRWAPNQLRHAAGTEVRKRFGLEAAQVTLGHSTARITEVYAERDLAKAIEVAHQVG